MSRHGSTLVLKAWRDTLAHAGQFISLILLVALGIMSYVTFQNAYFDLRGSLDRAYSELRFADLAVRVDRMPFSAAREVERLPGVSSARGMAATYVSTLGLPFLSSGFYPTRAPHLPPRPRQGNQGDGVARWPSRFEVRRSLRVSICHSAPLHWCKAPPRGRRGPAAQL